MPIKNSCNDKIILDINHNYFKTSCNRESKTLKKRKKTVEFFSKTSILLRILTQRSKKNLNKTYEFFTYYRPHQYSCQRGHYSSAGAFFELKKLHS